MAVGECVLVIAELDLDGYRLLARLASKYDNVIWLSSNPCIPRKILDSISYKGNARIFGFRKNCGNFVNPMNLNEIISSIFKAGANEENSCVVISCISELLMLHKIEKIYQFLIKLLNGARKVFGMLIDGAQERRDELLISTLFDISLRFKKEFNSGSLDIILNHETQSSIHSV